MPGKNESLCLEEAKGGYYAFRQDAAWRERIEELVTDYFREELTPEVLETHEDGSQHWAMFASYAVGWLVAQQVSGDLPAEDVEVAFAHLPGYMWLNDAKICAQTGA